MAGWRRGRGWALLALLPLVAAAGEGGDPQLRSGDGRKLRGPLIMDRGDDRQDVYFPREEDLEYSVILRLGLFGDHEVGRVTMSSRVSPFLGQDDHGESDEGQAPEQATVSTRAIGSYNVYSVDEVIRTKFLPQRWPKLLHTSHQTGTENRRRELQLGVKEGVPTALYRGDGHCKGCDDQAHFVDAKVPWKKSAHCKECKGAEHRVWKAYKSRKIPENSVDMITGVMLARTVVQQGRAGTEFTLVDRDKLWNVELTRGRRARHKVSAGTFDVVEVRLKTRPPEGEKGREDDFTGLFGLHGHISIWMHPESGVPVEITGQVPVGPLDLDVQIQLESYKGTPESFRKVVK